MKNASRLGVITIVDSMIVVAMIGLLAAMAIPAYQKIHDKNTGIVRANAIDREGQFTFSEAGYVTSERAIVITETKTGKRFLAVRNYGIAPLDEVKVESK